MWTCTCGYTKRPEVSVRCLPQWLSIFFALPWSRSCVLFLRFIHFYLMNTACMYACVPCACSTHEGQKRVLEPPRTRITDWATMYVGAENWTWVHWKIGWCSWPPSHLLSLHLVFWDQIPSLNLMLSDQLGRTSQPSLPSALGLQIPHATTGF